MSSQWGSNPNTKELIGFGQQSGYYDWHWAFYTDWKIYCKLSEKIIINQLCGGARGVMVIVVGNGHGDTSSNPGRDWLHFT